MSLCGFRVRLQELTGRELESKRDEKIHAFRQRGNQEGGMMDCLVV